MPERPVLLAVAEPLGRVFDLGLGTAQDTDLSVLDTASGRSLFSVAFDRQPGPSAGHHGSGAAADARTGRAFVASMSRTCSCVHVLDARSGAVLRTVAVGYPGRNPVAAAVDEQTGRVFVVTEADNSVSVLDARTGTLLRTVAVPTFPTAVAVDPRTSRVFVTSRGPGSRSITWSRPPPRSGPPPPRRAGG